MPRLLLALLAASLILITVAVLLAVKALTPDGEDHRVHPTAKLAPSPKGS